MLSPPSFQGWDFSALGAPHSGGSASLPDLTDLTDLPCLMEARLPSGNSIRLTGCWVMTSLPGGAEGQPPPMPGFLFLGAPQAKGLQELKVWIGEPSDQGCGCVGI